MKKIVLLTAIVAITGCQSSNPVNVAPSNAVKRLSSDELNSMTSRAKRDDYACKVATTPGLKPMPRELDNFRSDMANFAYVDLYGDGTIETVSGFSDEMYKANEDDPRYAGNRERSREYSDYMFFSPDRDFEVPKDRSFFMARNIIPSDLNGDGVDDLVMVQHGPDYAPYVAQPNYVLMSSKDGYKKVRLPGKKSKSHGGAVGDINGDGFLDIVTTPSEANEIVGYLNDGKGNFKYTVLIGAGRDWSQNDRNYNAQLWDVDKDGFIDLIVDGHEELAAIYWGQQKSGFFGQYFNQTPTRIMDLDNQLFQDVAFSDIDGDGNTELTFVSSIKLPDEKHFYQGWEVSMVEFEGRKPLKKRVLHRKESPGRYNWLPYVNACDLRDDGDVDFVILINGQRYNYGEQSIDKFVFENKKGEFTLHMLNGEMYLQDSMKVDLEETRAKEMGVTIKGYEPAQVYYKSPDGKRFLNSDRWPE